MFLNALTFAGPRGNSNISERPGKVYALKQTCMIVILAYLLIPLLNRIEYAVKLLELLYLYVESNVKM